MTKKDISEREFELTEPLAYGWSKKMIAAKHNLSIYTVETTVKNVYAKLRASNLAEFLMWYYAVTYDIAEEIKDKAKEVSAIVGLLILMSAATLTQSITLRRNNARNLQAQTIQIASSRMRSRRRERNEDKLVVSFNTIKIWTT